jgi:transposase InsO family protein
MKYGFIEEHRSTFSVEKMCQTLEVSRSGYYRWLQKPKSKREEANETLLEEIRKVHKASGETYGSPRITDELRANGHKCSENRIARLMRKNDIVSITAPKFKVTTNSKHDLPVAQNLVNRDFSADAPNRLWLSDITFVWTVEGWLYLAVILDVFSRKIVGWSMSNRIDKALVINALKDALRRRRVEPGLIFHSDRGSQYAAHDVAKLLENKQMKQSMSRKGDCWDNAMMESFFASLKKEFIYPFKTFQTRQEAKQSIFYYIEVFYNRIRRHSSIGNIAPEKFEKLKSKNAA